MTFWDGDIVLINPPFAANVAEYVAPPIGILQVADILRSRLNVNVSVLDYALEFCEKRSRPNPKLPETIAAKLARRNESVFGFSVQCFNMPIAVTIARHLKALRPSAKLIFGGHHTTLIANEIRNRYGFIDDVIEGSFENYFSNNSDHSIDPFAHRPAYELGPDINRYAHASRIPTALVETSRGCPFECSFCSIPPSFGRKVFHKPIEKLASELEKLSNESWKVLHFVSDIFTLRPEYVRSVLRVLKNLKRPMQWTAMTRVDLVTPELLKEMGAAGCISILYGVESASPSTLDAIKKSGNHYPSLPELVQWNLDAGIHASFYFILDLPSDSAETIEETLREIGRISVLDPGIAQLRLLRPVPGTPLLKKHMQELEPDYQSPYAHTIIETIGEDASEVWSEIARNKDLYATYFTVPGALSSQCRHALGWLGSRLFAMLPHAMAMLGEHCGFIPFFDRLGTSVNAHQMRGISDRELAMAAMNCFPSEDEPLDEVLSFDLWREFGVIINKQGGYRESEYLNSRVDPLVLRNSVLESSKLNAVVLQGKSRLYRRRLH